MKLLSITRILSASALIAIALSPSSSFARKPPNWVHVAESGNGDQIYVDANSIRKSTVGRYPSTQYWMKNTYGRIASTGEVRSITKVVAYCDANMYRLDAHYTYDRSNQIIKRFEAGTQQNPGYPSPEPVPPNSTGESAVEYACSR